MINEHLKQLILYNAKSKSKALENKQKLATICSDCPNALDDCYPNTDTFCVIKQGLGER